MAASRTQLGLSHQENALNFDMERLGFQLWAQPNQELIVRRIQSAFVSGLCSLHVDFILTLRFNKLANHLGLEVRGKERLSLPSRSGASPRVRSDWITVGHVAPFTQISDWPGLGYRVHSNPSL